MGSFFTRERFGRPQFLAGILLLVFLAQCLWLVNHSARHSENTDVFRVDEGLRQWRGMGIAGTPSTTTIPEAAGAYQPLIGFESNGGFDPDHSPMWYLIASAPFAVFPSAAQADLSPFWGWLARLPYLVFGMLLGASLWYVARRLYGNAGGYIALVLYCFSPVILRATAMFAADPKIGAAWAAFGAVFTGIAVAHTLYAPREVVLWNWRRIVLLGLSLALAVGSQFSLVIVVPMALLFMLYVAPTRRGAALAIWAAACVLAAFLLLASYFLYPGALAAGMRHADFFGINGRAFGMAGAYRRVGERILESGPALAIAVPLCLAVFAGWRHARYFGNTAPLLVAGLFLILGAGSPHYPGLGFQLMAIPFLFVFVAGVTADMLETKYRELVMACVWGLLMANCLWNVLQLVRIRG
jgi:hypothetical protein